MESKEKSSEGQTSCEAFCKETLLIFMEEVSRVGFLPPESLQDRILCFAVSV